MNNGWTKIAPGCWQRDDPIDAVAATALMEERLAAHGYRLQRRKPSWRATVTRWVRGAR